VRQAGLVPAGVRSFGAGNAKAISEGNAHGSPAVDMAGTFIVIPVGAGHAQAAAGRPGRRSGSGRGGACGARRCMRGASNWGPARLRRTQVAIGAIIADAMYPEEEFEGTIPQYPYMRMRAAKLGYPWGEWWGFGSQHPAGPAGGSIGGFRAVTTWDDFSDSSCSPTASPVAGKAKPDACCSSRGPGDGRLGSCGLCSSSDWGAGHRGRRQRAFACVAPAASPAPG